MSTFRIFLILDASVKDKFDFPEILSDKVLGVIPISFAISAFLIPDLAISASKFLNIIHPPFSRFFVINFNYTHLFVNVNC